jgi:hypothetical protein
MSTKIFVLIILLFAVTLSGCESSFNDCISKCAIVNDCCSIGSICFGNTHNGTPATTCSKNGSNECFDKCSGVTK